MKKLYSLLLITLMALVIPKAAIAQTEYLQYDDVAISQLSGKTIKRVIPSMDGKYLYILAHASNKPTILVYDHVAKAVKYTLGTANCKSTRTYANTGNMAEDISAIGDIALTDDGVLIGVGNTKISSTAKANARANSTILQNYGLYFYRWNNDAAGVPNGEAVAWNINNEQGNWSNGICGQSLIYKGSSTNGYIYYSAQSASGTAIRFCRVTIGYNSGAGVYGITGSGYYANCTSYNANNIGDAYALPSPWQDFNYILINSSSLALPIRLSFLNQTQRPTSTDTGTPTAPGETTYLSTNYPALGVIPTAARHTHLFLFNNVDYIVSPTATGVAVVKVDNGFSTAAASGVTYNKAMTSNTVATSAAAGASVDGNMTLFVVDQAGRISKYSPVLLPTVSIAASSSSSDGKQYANISIAHGNAQTYELQKLNGSTWTTIYTGAVEGTKKVEITGETTFRVIAYNSAGGGTTSNQVTVVYSTIDAPVASIELVTNGSAKDSKISWNAVDGAVSYSIEKSTDGTTWSALASGLTGLTYTDAGVQSLVEVSYRIYGIDANGVKSPASNVVSVWPAFEPYQPTITGQTWNGHSKVELNWEIPSENKPSSYNVYCDGVLIASGVEIAHYVHYGVPAGNHEYYIESVYDSRPGITGQSNTLIIGVDPRAIGNVMYRIEEEYNYPIDETFASQTGLPLFDNQDYYRQGKLFKEDDGTWSWYISQRNDENPATDNDRNSTGGVVRFKADAGSMSQMASSAEKILTIKDNSTVGLAMDEQGNIFVRERTPIPVATISNGSTFDAGDYSYGGYGTHFSKGIVFKRYAGGVYKDYGFAEYDWNNWSKHVAYSGNNAGKEGTDYKIIDLSDLGLTLNRADYYAAEGNIFDGDGSIYISSCFATNVTDLNGGAGDNRSFYKAAIRGGAYTASQNMVISPTQDALGTENFFFPILPNMDDARDDYIVQVRSNAYVNVNNDGSQRQVIYSTTSRVHNAGGTTAWFNGDMFLVTPEFMGSKNTGDFYVAKAVKDDLSKVNHPNEAVFSEATMVPIASVSYPKNDDVPAMNANAVWFGCVPHEGLSGAADVDNVFNETYMDIYEYIPGVRFAKYKLIPYLEILNPSVTMVVDVETDPEATTITNFVGKAAWKELSYPGEDFKLKYFHVNITKEGVGTPLMSFYVRQQDNAAGGHDHIICDADGNAVESDIEIFSENRDEYDSDGILRAREWCYVLLDGKKYDIADNQDCVIAVRATFEKVNEVTTTIESDYSQAIDQAHYEPEIPSGTVVIDQEGVPFKVPDQWTPFPDGPKENGEDGYWSYKWRVNYRVDIDFDKVTATSDLGVKLPVSHYEIYYVPKGSSIDDISEPVKNFTLIGTDDAGNMTATAVTDGKIPGTYDFDGKNYAIPLGEGDGTSQLQKSVLSFYVQPNVTVPNDNPGKGQFTLVNSNDDPYTGTFYVRAVYAANTYASIEKTRHSAMRATKVTTTGVNELVNLSARDYITPNVTSDYTVAHSTESITSIVIYNINGAVAAKIDGNGDCAQQVRVDDLASGIYFVTINGGKAHRMVKK